MSKDDPREYGAGSVYQRKSDARWVAVVKSTYTKSGARGTTTVTGKGCPGGCAKKCPHRAAILRKLRDAKAAQIRGQEAANRTTVKKWADTYLEMRLRDLAPKAYNAAANPIKNWVVPTLGHKRLSDLTPADIRAVHDACRDQDRSPADVHRALHTMLKSAVAEGHEIAQRVLAVKAPAANKSDRMSMTIPEGLACLEAAARHPRGSRWIFTLIYGQRMGECLGLTTDAIDLTMTYDADGKPVGFGEAIVEWQLQPLPYNVHRDRSSGFRVPDGYEARHLIDSYHLVRPKSAAGYRVAPFLPFVRDAMLLAIKTAPENPWGLIWPAASGRPMNDKIDRAEWWALQEEAGVHHPTRTRKVDGKTLPGYYHVHECRNFAATMLLEAGVDEHIITALLGHSSVVQSRKYMTVRRAPMLEALQRVGERLQLTPPQS